MILDTSFLIDVLRRDPAALALLDRLETGSESLHIPAPVAYELWEGIERSTNPIRELDAVKRTLEAYPPLDLTTDAAKRAARLSARLCSPPGARSRSSRRRSAWSSVASSLRG